MDKKSERYKVEQLQLARIQLAQMKDEIAELTSRQDWTAHEKELNERHARELYEQKMFFKGLMEEQKESHRVGGTTRKWRKSSFCPAYGRLQ